MDTRFIGKSNHLYYRGKHNKYYLVNTKVIDNKITFYYEYNGTPRYLKHMVGGKNGYSKTLTTPRGIATTNEVFDNHYKMSKQIGKGASGDVFEGIQLRTGKKVAIKRMTKELLDPLSKDKVRNEVKMLILLGKTQDSGKSKCDKHHIICYHDFFEDDTYYYIVIEYLKESLTDLMNRKNIKEDTNGLLERINTTIDAFYKEKLATLTSKIAILQKQISDENIVMPILVTQSVPIKTPILGSEQVATSISAATDVSNVVTPDKVSTGIAEGAATVAGTATAIVSTATAPVVAKPSVNQHKKDALKKVKTATTAEQQKLLSVVSTVKKNVDLGFNKIYECSLNKALIRKIVNALCNAIDYMHSLNVAHQDLKPDNIMLTENCEIKIIDFDTSCDQKECPIGSTFMYKSPEIDKQEIIRQKNTTLDVIKRNDIWAYCMIILVMILGYDFVYDTIVPTVASGFYDGYIQLLPMLYTKLPTTDQYYLVTRYIVNEVLIKFANPTKVPSLDTIHKQIISMLPLP